MILDIIRKLRNEDRLDLLRTNNRYSIGVREKDFDITYHFSVPCYKESDGKIIDSVFHKDNNTFILYGSNAKISVDREKIHMVNRTGAYSLFFDKIQRFDLVNNELISEKYVIKPTTNGVVVGVVLSMNTIPELRVVSDKGGKKIKNNTKMFAIMHDKFHPSVTLSAMFIKTVSGFITPLLLNNEKVTEGEYKILLGDERKMSGIAYLEFNMYEDKFIQDTTVESKHEKENNAYGGISFLGTSDEYGEQRLYIKPNLDMISDIHPNRIASIQLIIPKFFSTATVHSYQLNRRFCSFGSNWSKMIPHTKTENTINDIGDYYVIDMNNSLANKTFRYGTLLVTDIPNGNCVISTGDCFFRPQFFEIKYRR